MKKFIAGLLLGLVLATAPVALAAGRIRLIVDGRDVTPADVAPQSINGRVMVPARALADALGATVSWSAELNAVVIRSNGPIALELDPTKWTPLTVVAVIPGVKATAQTDWIKVVKGDIMFYISLLHDANGNILDTLPLSVQRDGLEIEAGQAHYQKTGTWLPTDLLIKYGVTAP